MGWPYQQKPPMGWPLDYDSGLVPNAGFWPMLEGSGNKIFDLSGNGGTGIFVADAVYVAGQYGPAIKLDGTGDYITIPDSKLLDIGTNDFTIVINMLINSNDAGVVVRLLNKRDGSNIGYELYKDTDDKLSILIGDGTLSFGLTGTTTFADDLWHQHIVIFNRAGNVVVYFDGVQDGTRDISGSSGDISNTVPLLIGAFQGGLQTPEAIYDYVYIYNHALSASKIVLLYRYSFWMFKDPAEIALLGGYQVVGNAGIMTTNTGFWGPTF